jgi:large subunit ribosomal protein L24e
MKCTYCSREISKGTGMMYVYRTGAINYFCSRRCFRNSVHMHRKINKKELKNK